MSCKIGRFGLKLLKVGGFIGCSCYFECGFTYSLYSIRGVIVSDTDDLDFVVIVEDFDVVMYFKVFGVDLVIGKEIFF